MLMSEQMIADLSKATDLNHVILRYFNVAGSDPDGKIGQSTKNATLLIKIAAEVAVGMRDKLLIFGIDYPTSDGPGIRNYIHVSDLAAAHINALDYLQNGAPINVEEMPRRAGDPPELISVADKIHSTIGWQPQYDDLNLIVKTSLAWEKKLLAL